MDLNGMHFSITSPAGQFCACLPRNKSSKTGGACLHLSVHRITALETNSLSPGCILGLCMIWNSPYTGLKPQFMALCWHQKQSTDFCCSSAFASCAHHRLGCLHNNQAVWIHGGSSLAHRSAATLGLSLPFIQTYLTGLM